MDTITSKYIIRFTSSGRSIHISYSYLDIATNLLLLLNSLMLITK